jgi:hypothetical protein
MEICIVFLVVVFIGALLSNPKASSQHRAGSGQAQPIGPINDEDLLMGLLIIDDINRQSEDEDQ